MIMRIGLIILAFVFFYWLAWSVSAESIEITPEPDSAWSDDENSMSTGEARAMAESISIATGRTGRVVYQPLFRVRIGSVEVELWRGYLGVEIYQGGNLVEWWEIFAPNDLCRGFHAYRTVVGKIAMKMYGFC